MNVKLTPEIIKLLIVTAAILVAYFSHDEILIQVGF